MSDELKLGLLAVAAVIIIATAVGLINFFIWWIPKHKRRHRVMKHGDKYIIYVNFYGDLRFKCDDEWVGWSGYPTNSHVVRYNTKQEACAACADYPFNYRNRRYRKLEAQRKAELLNTYKREVEKPLDISKY